MSQKLRAIILGFIVYVLSAPLTQALAMPILWTMNSVTFDDGGTASGSFIYDSATDALTAIAITTTAGTIQPGTVYSYEHPSFPPQADATFFFIDSNLADLTDQTYFELLTFGPLTDAGGTVNIATGTEANCSNSTCTGINANTERNISGGSLTGTRVSVPEPSTLTLLSLGLAGLGFARRRMKE